MKAANLNIVLGLLAVSALYVVFYYPVGYIILTGCLAAAGFIVTNDLKTALGAIIFMIALRTLGNILSPKKLVVSGPSAEGFQAKDPLTIHQRITKEKKPVAKVPAVTGVLESANIFDNLHVGRVEPTEEGFANSSLAAPANAANMPIPTPADSSIPKMASPDNAPMSNPYLQNGPDVEAVDTAMANKGSALQPNVQAANLNGANVGAAPYS